MTCLRRLPEAAGGSEAGVETGGGASGAAVASGDALAFGSADGDAFGSADALAAGDSSASTFTIAPPPSGPLSLASPFGRDLAGGHLAAREQAGRQAGQDPGAGLRLRGGGVPDGDAVAGRERDLVVGVRQ